MLEIEKSSEDVNDQNFALSFDYNINDNMTAFLRWNERRSLRVGNFGSVEMESPQKDFVLVPTLSRMRKDL